MWEKIRKKKHIRRCKDLEEHECKECHKVFVGQSKFESHRKTHRGIDCKKCGERIPANSQTSHNKTKHPKELLKCEQCEFETKYQETLNKHLLTHIPKEPKDKTSYTCIHCEKS